MTDENTSFNISDYLEIALRHKWLIILPVLVILPLTIIISFYLPKLYKAETTILVIPQNIPDAFVRSTVTMNPSEYLNVISEEIKSRTNLEKVIQKLSPKLVDNIPGEQLINQMRSKISIDVQHNRNRSVSSFKISYSGKDPIIVAKATNLMANLFIEENLNRRANQAKKTAEFLFDELRNLELILEERELLISDFKQRNLGSLPEQRDSNLRMLDQLILQRQRITGEINDAENRKITLQQQFIQSDGFASSSGNEQELLNSSPLLVRINEIKRLIANLKNKYTDQHPDVIAAQTELNQLLTLQTNDANSDDLKTVTPLGNAIDSQLLAINLEIKNLKKEESTVKSKIDEYQKRVEMAPKLEQELFAISRDYQNTKTAYDELMIKHMEATQAEKLEIDQQGEQFKILDEAKVPTKPFKPNQLKIILMGFMFALALGAGLVILKEFLHQTFYTVKDIESRLDLPVLVSIPLASEETLKELSN